MRKMGRLFKSMKKSFTASVWQEEKMYVAQCLEVDVASQGETEQEALSNLQEALELHFESPVATLLPEIKKIQAEVSVA
ncbi:type II toxin-antitoxin system HicB family antitoxin [Leptospira weilii]|nr:type II toxin-antitoxin system HicB family antitoxin [Leptospira weilii]